MTTSASDDDHDVIRPHCAAPPTEFQKAEWAAVSALPTSATEKREFVAPMQDDGGQLPVGTMLAEFRLTELIGEGGFGVVYSAFDTSLEREVALKEYMPSSLAARIGRTAQVQVRSERFRETFEAGRKSFIGEAKLLARFDHPSLVKVYRFWEDNGTAYMVMPLLRGRTLKDVLREMKRSSQSPDEAWLLSLLGSLTEALLVIHAEQVYHRDIAPDNVMYLPEKNHWLLLDFGAARRVISEQTQALTVILKPGYAPVEQYAEIPGMKQGPWTDVYALAAVVHFAIVGTAPMPSVGRLLNDTYQRLSTEAAGRFSERLLSAVDRALVVRPEQRTQSIREFRQAIGLDEVAGLASPCSTQPMPARDPSVPTQALRVAAAAVASDAGGEPWSVRHRGRMSECSLLFTDLVDSTQTVQRLGDDEAAQLWIEHDRRARQLLQAHAGQEIDRSDGFFLIFDDTVRAARYAVAYHEAIAALGLTARVGLHVGDVTLRENDLQDVARGAKQIEVDGLAKPLAARVMALACGGQTLLTATAKAALTDALPEGVETESHGHYRLKGVEQPTEIFEIGRRGHCPFRPPPDADKAYRVVQAGKLWRPLREVRHNLVSERDAFVGRAAELRALAQRLDGGVRLLTLLGSGGTGKTRLIRHYGLAWLGDWPGGVYFCDLSEATGLDGIQFAVALALEVPLGQGDPTVQLGHAIAARGRCLVILDNFEQLVAHAASTLGRWLDRAGEAAFAVTSRERLQLPGEEVLAVEPLSLASEALELFEVRARAQRPDFAINDTNRDAVAEVVRLLDGLPLAIELAAARIRIFSPAQLVQRMTDRFQLLAGARGMAERQATLAAAIDWSWGLLTPWERDALAQCSVFEGGFTMEAAEAVLELGAWPGASTAMDTVQSLVDKSLLRAWVPLEQGRLDIDEPYFGMYLSIHEYAARKLVASGASGALQAHQRHGRHFADAGCDAAIAALDGPDGRWRLRTLTLDLDNLVAACRRAVARGDGAVAIASLRAAWEVLELRGPFAVGVALAAQVLALADATSSQAPTALHLAGRVHRQVGDMELAAAELSRALGLAQAGSDRCLEGRLHRVLSTLERERGRMDAARRHIDAALALHRAAGDRHGEALALHGLGSLQFDQGGLEQARLTQESALPIVRAVGNARAEARLLSDLAVVCSQLGCMEPAQAHFGAALVIGREIGDRAREGHALGNLAIVFLDQGRLEEALAHFEQSLAIVRDVGDRRMEGRVLGNLSALRFVQGRLDQAVPLAEAALAIHREVGNRRSEAIILGNMGDLLRGQGRLDEARARYDQALALHREVGNRRNIGSTQCSQGLLLLDLGQIEAAREVLREGESVLREIGERLELGKVLCALGQVDVCSGDGQRASAALAESESIAVEIGCAPDSDLGQQIAKLRAMVDPSP